MAQCLMGQEVLLLMEMKNLFFFFFSYLLGRFSQRPVLSSTCSFHGSSCTQFRLSRVLLRTGRASQCEAGFSVREGTWEWAREPPGTQKVGLLKRAGCFSFSFILISTSVGFFYIQRGSPIPKPFQVLGFFFSLKLKHLVTS